MNSTARAKHRHIVHFIFGALSVVIQTQQVSRSFQFFWRQPSNITVADPDEFEVCGINPNQPRRSICVNSFLKGSNVAGYIKVNRETSEVGVRSKHTKDFGRRLFT
ncbi:hypothetical protein BCR33DRAFT_718341 [Rhizoclosmatium globosum]|uniref:Uncharacterized protein n=1 Tax=Rhizoclosmatium globosum TaxID=329046 RepID=A0A1Y2C6I2_9FUNG|nr:hypothetical protein BCR33DRAFT_718341 [Rhizoclosmatium globosum]|eukprot:ORY42649.1 hypothetical protein BCR33DRAFT_718341 [Rhizoclosmatium globosum]